MPQIKVRFADFIRSLIRRVAPRVVPALGWLVAAAILVRLTVRDRLPVLSTFFYATPYPLLLIGCAGAALLLAARRRWKRAAVAAGLALVSGALYFHTGHIAASPPPADPGLKVLVWNTARGKGDPAELMDHVAAADADLVGLVEAAGRRSPRESEWKQRFPGYEVRAMDGGMLLMVRGELVSHRYERLGRRARFNVATVRISGRELRLVLVDLHANPLVSKRPAYEMLERLIAENADGPLIVMGDFNTPLESVYFDRLRARGLAHAFVSAGRGFAETWPALLPLLSIDHVWLSAELRAVRCELQRSGASDHRSVEVEVVYAGPAD